MPKRNVRRGFEEKNEVLHDRKFVTALARGLQILGEFESEGGLGNLELAERTGLPRATVTRLTYTLIKMGYLRQMPTGKYCAGVGFLGLSASIQRNLGIQRIARPFIEALAHELNCSVVMGMRDRNSMIFLEVARPARAGLIVNTDVGSALPIHSTAIGMAYLVAAPLTEREDVLELLRDECRAEWETVRRAIEQSNASYKKHGFVTWIRSWSRDVNAVAVPLKVDSTQSVYSFICAGPSREMSRRRLLDVYGPRLAKMVAQINADVERERPATLPGTRRPH